MPKITPFLITAILFLGIGLNFIWQPNQLANISNSTITGLAMMRSMATETITYQDAIANNKPTLIEFYADWCTTCQAMSPILKNLKTSYEEQVNFVMINIDYPENNQLIKKYQVIGVPQWNFLNSQGEIQDNLVGKVPEKVLESILIKNFT